MRDRLTLSHVGPIKDAKIIFGDLTVFVGPQAGGKSIVLQWLKLVEDIGQIQFQLDQYGMDWHRDLAAFLDLYFGEGMHSLWDPAKSQVTWNGSAWDAPRKVARMARKKDETVALIPAQRVLTLRDGWPRPFSDYSAGDPFSVRWFSEKLRLLMEQDLGASDAVFPKPNRLKREYRSLIAETIFGRFSLTVDSVRSQKRLVLGRSGAKDNLPYMVWSAGQREFVPLLLGLYSLMPPAKVARRGRVRWAIIEEPEMGLHPRAITVVLLMILDLLDRGYRVCVSTHSPQVLDLVWALQVLAGTQPAPERVLRVFDVAKTPGLRDVAANALGKECRVYYFAGDGGPVHEITKLDPSAMNAQESTWGGLLEFAGRVNEVVATAMSAKRTPFQS